MKVLSPEKVNVALGQGFCPLETETGRSVRGEFATGVPGSESMAGKRIVYIGTWENRSVPKRSFQGVEETTREYGVSVVGLTHSKGVGRVMPVAYQKEDTLEGVSNLTQRESICYAIR